MSKKRNYEGTLVYNKVHKIGGSYMVTLDPLVSKITNVKKGDKVLIKGKLLIEVD